MKLNRTQKRKLKAAGWIEDETRLFWRSPVDGNYYAPARAWVIYSQAVGR